MIPDDLQIRCDMLFGSIELKPVEYRIDGRYLVAYGRSIHRDRHGNVIKDETYDLGTRIENWESCADLFGVSDPRSWWQRFRDWL